MTDRLQQVVMSKLDCSTQRTKTTHLRLPVGVRVERQISWKTKKQTKKTLGVQIITTMGNVMYLFTDDYLQCPEGIITERGFQKTCSVKMQVQTDHDQTLSILTLFEQKELNNSFYFEM